MAYTSEQRALAVAILERYGMSQEAFDAIGQALGKTPSTYTLHQWLRGVHPKPKTKTKKQNQNQKSIPEDVLQTARESLDELFERVAYSYLEKALQPEKTKDMKGKDLVMAAAIATDKMRLLRDLPTEVVQILPSVVTAMRARGLDPYKTFEALEYELTVGSDN